MHRNVGSQSVELRLAGPRSKELNQGGKVAEDLYAYGNRVIDTSLLRNRIGGVQLNSISSPRRSTNNERCPVPNHIWGKEAVVTYPLSDGSTKKPGDGKRRTAMMKSASSALCGFLLSFVLLITACTPAAPEVSTPPPSESTDSPTAPEATEVSASTEPSALVQEQVVLRAGTLQDTDCWNFTTCEGWWQYGYLTTEGLTRMGPASEGCPGIPGMAKSWEVSDDGRTWTIELYEGITFQDGTPVTAQTIVDFIDWWRSSEELLYWYYEWTVLDSIEVIDDYTFTYTTEDPILSSPDYNWIWFHIYPLSIWGDVDDTTLYTFENYPPIGAGPYKLVEHLPGDHMIYDAWEKYHLGKPPIDRLVIQIFTNTDAIINALLAGDIDVTMPQLPPEAYDVLIGAPNITVEEKNPGVAHRLNFNMWQGEGGNKHPAIDDPAVREAIDYAIDKQQIVDIALLGHGVTCPSNWACGPNYEGELNPDLIIYPFDLSKANQILGDAGYLDTDGDGVRETADGLPLELRLYYQIGVPPAAAMSDMITEWLSFIGITVLPEAMDWGTWLSFVAGQRDFDMAIDATPPDIDPAAIDFWHSCWSAEAGIGGDNYAGYCNEEVDNYFYEYMFSGDPEGRFEPIFKAQAIMNHDRPFILLAGQNGIQAYRNDRFEFPSDTCAGYLGFYSNEGLMGAVVK